MVYVNIFQLKVGQNIPLCHFLSWIPLSIGRQNKNKRIQTKQKCAQTGYIRVLAHWGLPHLWTVNIGIFLVIFLGISLEIFQCSLFRGGAIPSVFTCLQAFDPWDFFNTPLDHYLTLSQQVVFQSLELQEGAISLQYCCLAFIIIIRVPGLSPK